MEKILFISTVNKLGRIIYPKCLNEKIKLIIKNALDRIKIERSLYDPGYYEFAYSSKDGVYFIDAIHDEGYIK